MWGLTLWFFALFLLFNSNLLLGIAFLVISFIIFSIYCIVTESEKEKERKRNPWYPY